MSPIGFHGGLDKAGFCKLARSFAQIVERGEVIGLIGDLGAGKTTFCAEVVACLSKEEFLGSPTFVIVNSYECLNFFLYHIDLYRISSFDELSEIGICDVATEENVLFVEWPEILNGKISLDIIITINDTIGTEGKMRDVTIERRSNATYVSK